MKISAFMVVISLASGLLLFCSSKTLQSEDVVFNHPMLEMPTGFVIGKPNELTNMSGGVLINQIYESLFSYDGDLNLKPILIDRWIISRDDQSYIFYLKKGILFQNGQELTADDVIYSINYINKHYTQNRSITDDSIKKCGRYCFSMSFGATSPQIVILFTGSLYKIVPKDSIKEGVIPPGTGPFMVSKNYGNIIELKRFPKYRDKGNSNISSCKFIYMTKQDAITAFLKREVDDLFEYVLKADELNGLKGNIVSMPTYIINYIGLNTRVFPFNNKKIRLAVQGVINRKNLYEKYFSEHLMANGVVPRGLIGGARNNYMFDLPQLEAIAAMGKYTNDNVEVEFWIRNQDWNQDFVWDVVNDMAKIGIRVIVKKGDDAEFYEKYFSRKQQMFFITIGASYKDATDILSSFSSTSNDNDVGISDLDIDKELQLLSVEFDRNKRAEIIRKIEDMIIDKAAVIPIYQRVSSTIYQEYIKNVNLTPS